MVNIGVRSLRDGLSAHLRAVQAGETITVTDHGQAIARIVPYDSGDAFDRLVAEGLIVLPADHPDGLPEPIATGITISDLIER